MSSIQRTKKIALVDVIHFMFPVKDYSILRLEISQLSYCRIMMAALLQDRMKQSFLVLKWVSLTLKLKK